MELEREIESYIGREVRRMGCLWYKWVSPGARGVPDRILITPQGWVFFIELKTETGVLSPLQKNQISLLESRHQSVYVIRGMDEAKDFIKWLREWK